MHDTRGVRGEEHCRDLLRDLQLDRRIEAIPEGHLKALAFNQLHHQPVAVVAFDEIVDAADVRVVEQRQDARLTQEAGFGDRIETVLHVNRLHCDPALQRLVETDVDLSHSAFAKAIEDPVVRNENVRRGSAPANKQANEPAPGTGVLTGGTTLRRQRMTKFPDWIVPMAATLTQERFTGPEWIFERKFDGIRLLAFKQGADVRLYLTQSAAAEHPGDRRRRSRTCRRTR